MKDIKRDDLRGMRGLAVVELYKPGCRPCEQLQPTLDQLSERYDGRLSFYASHFVGGGLGKEFGLHVENVPTIILLKDGKMVEHFPGAKYVHGIGRDRTAADTIYLTRRLDKFLSKHLQNDGASVMSVRSKVGDLETELDLSDNSLVTLRERYLKKDENGQVAERPEDMFRRVADNIAQADLGYGHNEEQVRGISDEFYELITSLKFLPNSPTLMNAGRDLQQLSACFVLPVEDSMESIFGAAMEGALVHKSGGGTGYSFSRLRPKNAIVRSTSGVASGPVSFIDVFNVYTETVKQGGTRRGANMGVLAVDHPDIRGFIHAKGRLNESGQYIVDKVKEEAGLDENDPVVSSFTRKLLERHQLNNFNISVGITEGFMDAVKEDDDFELRDPRNGEVVEKVRARELLEEIADQAWRTGDPGVVFLDRINEYNPTPNVGRIESTNPCGEQPLLPYESCNLGSINLAKFVADRKVDYDALRDTVHKSVHFLDNVIDMNRYPIERIEEMTKANRKIGLGIMGFGDMTTMMRVPYGSEESAVLAREVMRFIRDEARAASVKLAEERGVFPNWNASIYDPESEHFRGEKLRLRNATLTTIAPTGTLSKIADCESGIEPPFSLAYTATVMDGKVLRFRARGLEHVLREEGYDSDGIFTELEEGRRDKLEELPDNIKRLAVTSMRLSPDQHIRMQAAFQEYTDNAVSKTINLPSTATRKDIGNAFLLAHELGCKGITVYRDKSKDVQVLEEKVGHEHDFGSDLPKEILSITREEQVGDGKRIFVTVGYWESPQNQRVIERLRKEDPTQYFVDANFFDPRTQALITALAIRGSKDLRVGTSKEEIVKDLRDLPPADEVGYDDGFGPGREYVNRSIPDGIWKAMDGWMPPTATQEKKVNDNEHKKNDGKRSENGFAFCNECSRYGVMSREGCDTCIYCGNSTKGCP